MDQRDRFEYELKSSHRVAENIIEDESS